jgi:hypothetical protein
MQRQSSLSGLALEHHVHWPRAWPRWNASNRNLEMSLEWQLNKKKPVLYEDCISLLPDVAERADEVVPVQYGSRTIRCAASDQKRAVHHALQLRGKSHAHVGRGKP